MLRIYFRFKRLRSIQSSERYLSIIENSQLRERPKVRRLSGIQRWKTGIPKSLFPAYEKE
ncbi:MAG: hypothetical protein CSA34_03820 [Desulfobulbus propionicus]|nr:MAG: hypothetical protein CSA34_03820 [Desulfobulbus propionicus]